MGTTSLWAVRNRFFVLPWSQFFVFSGIFSVCLEKNAKRYLWVCDLTNRLLPACLTVSLKFEGCCPTAWHKR